MVKPNQTHHFREYSRSLFLQFDDQGFLFLFLNTLRPRFLVFGHNIPIHNIPIVGWASIELTFALRIYYTANNGKGQEWQKHLLTKMETQMLELRFLNTHTHTSFSKKKLEH